MQKTIGIPALLAMFFILLALAGPASAATLWVGKNTTACNNGTNVHPTLAAAMLAAVLSSENDEIRLTNTVTYYGNIGQTTFTDFAPGVSGRLILAGGYADCNSAQSGRALFGNNTGNTFTVNTSAQTSSFVTFRNIEIREAVGRAVVATASAEVVLENVWIHDNQAGVFVSAGAFIDMKSDTVIEDNTGYLVGPDTGTDKGGGIYCSGTDSQVSVYGRLTRNSARNGGNIYLSSGCFVELFAGARVEGWGFGANFQSRKGGGVFVDSGGEFFVSGGNPHVDISGNTAGDGGGIYITGSGRATLLNTRLNGNSTNYSAGTGEGAAIYAINGGTSGAQLVMDRVATCPFVITCSEIEGSNAHGSVIYVSNSVVDINRTIIELTVMWQDSAGFYVAYLVKVENSAEARLNAVSLTRNSVLGAFNTGLGGKVIATHVTIADNEGRSNGGDRFDAEIARVFLNSSFDIQNSIAVDTAGVLNLSGTVVGKCNLVDNGSGMPGTNLVIGTPLFMNKAIGDYRQQAASPGVDMCLRDYFAFSSELDLGYQARPVNEGTNAPGTPGEAGGNYDAGFWESYINVVGSFELKVVKTGTGSGTVLSVSELGIACGSDCAEIYDEGTVVELDAVPDAGSTVTWTGCDVSGGNQCAVTMATDKTVSVDFGAPTAVYQLNVTLAGTGSGTVVSTNTPGINCPSDCVQSYDDGTTVTLKATPDAGHTISWSGCNTSGGDQCSVTLDMARNVTATFTAPPTGGEIFKDSFE